jgi:hypothetical protein
MNRKNDRKEIMTSHRETQIGEMREDKKIAKESLKEKWRSKV